MVPSHVEEACAVDSDGHAVVGVGDVRLEAGSPTLPDVAPDSGRRALRVNRRGLEERGRFRLYPILVNHAPRWAPFFRRPSPLHSSYRRMPTICRDTRHPRSLTRSDRPTADSTEPPPKRVRCVTALSSLVRCLSIAFGLWVLSSAVLAADGEYLIDMWGTDGGLPSNLVNALAQTPEGYLWIGTHNGLARFDGLRFVVFDPANTPEIRHPRIDGLYVDRRGTLWINTGDGSLTAWLLCRLATSVPPPRLHTLRYAGVLASASPWRSRLAPQPPQAAAAGDEPGRPDHAGRYRPWAELLARTFAVDILACSRCQGRMRLLALVKDPASIARHPRHGGRGDRGAATLAGSRSAVLKEPRAAPQGSR
jgi:Two component regulator propeller